MNRDVSKLKLLHRHELKSGGGFRRNPPCKVLWKFWGDTYIHSSNCINFSTLLLSQTNPWVHGWELSNVSMKCISSLVPRFLYHFLGQARVHPGVCSKIVHKAMVRAPNHTCFRFELAHPLLQAESFSVQAYNQKQIHHFSIPVFLPPSSS